MDTQYAWQPRYEVGLEEIDAQHRYLFSLIGELHEFSEAAVIDRSARDLLREIDRYAFYHFNSEEVLMSVYRYPHLDAQKREHFNLLQVLDKRICDFRQQGTTVRPLAEFLREWFLKHLADQDREMAQFISAARNNKRGVPKTSRFIH
ncbi:MAG: hypothetical protein EA402_10885 [Planctomycetota bacterium]|nr:MAG: hypothetical protein EA402_10885 [Planctomycetota bacterium]